MKRCNKCEEWHVIDSTCKDCKKERERGEFIGLMTGELSDMKPIRNYIDNNGIFHEAGTREQQIREHHREEGHNI